MNDWFLETKIDEHTDDDVSLCIEFNEIREYTIGRRKGFDIVSQNPLVSRKHGIITLKPDGQIYIRDLQSANGTYINDKIIQPHTDCLLNKDDLLGIGAPTTATEERKEIFWVRRKSRKNENATITTETLSVQNRVESTSIVARAHTSEKSELVVASTRTTTLIPAQKNIQDVEQEAPTSRTTTISVPAQLKRQDPELLVPSISRVESTGTVGRAETSENVEQVVESRRTTTLIPAQKNIQDVEQEAPTSRTTTISVPAELKRQDPELLVPSISRVESTGTVGRAETSENVEQVVESRRTTTLIPAQKKIEDVEQETPTSRTMTISVPSRLKSQDPELVVPSTSRAVTKLVPAQERSKNEEEVVASTTSSTFHSRTNAIRKKLDSGCGMIKNCNTNSTNMISNDNMVQESSSSIKSTLNTDSIMKYSGNTNNKIQTELKNNNDNINNKVSTETSNSTKILQTSKNLSLDEDDKKDVLKLNLNKKGSLNDSSNGAVIKNDNWQNENNNTTVYTSVENRKTILLQNNNIAPNDTNISSNEDVKLSVDYLNSLIEKSKNIKPSFIEIDLCSSSDEEYIETTNPNNLNTTLVDTKPNIADIKIIYDKSNENFEKNVQVKTEPQNFSFSQNVDDDILIISDDEDIFPKSQLFEVSVKKERNDNVTTATTGDTSPTSDENNEELNLDIFSNIKNEVHDYDYNNENDDDEDDDCIIWYSKLSQSQDFISTNRKVEPSPDEPDAADKDDFDFITSLFNDKADENITESDIEKPEDDDFRKDGASSTDIEDNEQPKSKVKSDNDESVKKKHQETRVVDKSFPSTSKLPASDEKEEEKSSKKKTETKKYVKPPVIDAPFLQKGKRKAHEEPKTKDKKAPVSKRRKSSHEETPSATTVNTAPQSSVCNKSVRTELEKRNKKRRQSVDTYSKNEKIKIQEDRKKKLKEIASKSVENKEKKEVQKSHTKPKVKVSSSRGLFLTGAEPEQTSSKNKSKRPTEEEQPKQKYKIPKRSDSVSSEPSTSKNSKADFARINKLSFNDLNSKTSSKSESKDSYSSNIKKISINTISEPPKERETVKRRQSILSNITNKPTGILLHPERIRKPKKNVTFNDELQIRIIPALPGNKGRKVTVKDAPVPDIHNIRETEEIISTVLEWRPAWLEEQKGKNVSPEVSKRKALRMLTNFNTIGDYFGIVQPLMLLELWKSVFRDWCANNSNVKLACIEKIVHRDTNTFITCYCLADKNDNDLPKYGDLILTEYYLHNMDSRIGTNKKFGYVLYANKRRMIPTDVVHKQFTEVGPIPPFKLTFTMQLKRSQSQILDEKLMRIRLVSRIAPPLRIFKSVSYLHNSPLCNLILKPSVQQYKITKPNLMNSVIEDNLNSDQMVCVYEAYHICTREEPGIYLIQGPPGTGKSFVVKNLVRQLLCGVSNNERKPRILLCAPSNGAVDEITHKLLDMRSKMSKNDRFKMIRIGPPNAILHPKVKSISVQDLVAKNIQAKQANELKTNSYMSSEYNFLIQKENTLKNKISSLEARKIDFSVDLHNLRKVQVQIEQLKSNSSLYYERRKEERDAEVNLIEKADIICTTLSSCISACSRLEELTAEKKIEFTCCIIDEATQSHEQESLIPLILGIKKFVLVGDPEQLPPTTISQEAKELGYGNSLFSRIQSCFDHLPDNPIRMLTHQYRMHPEICKFPSQTFYGGRLKTSPAVINKAENVLAPYRLFSLNTSRNFKESEYLNKTEANLVLLLTDIITKRTRYNVGIITPYTKQKDYLINNYRAMRAKENKENLEKDDERHLSRVAINTVDGFQGQERDVIIISSVRYKSNLFLNDIQRLNVALTRAKHAVFICAHADLFKQKSIWKQLECDAKSRNCFYLICEQDTTDDKYMSELILS